MAREIVATVKGGPPSTWTRIGLAHHGAPPPGRVDRLDHTVTGAERMPGDPRARDLWVSGPAQQRLYSTYLSDGITALLSSDQRSVSLGYDVNCGIIVPKNHDTPPHQFRFALYGHDGAGTGVRCQALPDSGGQHQLLGVDAAQDGNSFLINTTVIFTSNRGVTADSGLMRTDGDYGKTPKR